MPLTGDPRRGLDGRRQLGLAALASGVAASLPGLGVGLAFVELTQGYQVALPSAGLAMSNQGIERVIERGILAIGLLIRRSFRGALWGAECR
jgi:hypothetical protein